MAKTQKKTVKKKVARKKTTSKRTLSKKKASAKKAPASKPLSAAEIAHFKGMLLKKRSELLGDVNSIEDEALKKSRLDASGDLSSMPIHMADIGTDNYQQEFALDLLDSERKLLKEINDALNRITDNTYGVCEVTGKGISRPRLEAKPWARYCIAYARMVEQGLVEAGETLEQD